MCSESFLVDYREDALVTKTVPWHSWLGLKYGGAEIKGKIGKKH